MIIGYTQIVSDEFARPGDTNAYAARDVIGSSPGVVRALPNVGRFPGSSGYLTKIRFATDNKNAAPRIRAWFYSSAPGAIADNAPFALLYANRAQCIGYVDLPALAPEDATGSDSSAAINADIRLAFALEAGSRDLYYVLETLDAFTPASGSNCFLEVTAELN
jgi:hypothetical protein